MNQTIFIQKVWMCDKLLGISTALLKCKINGHSLTKVTCQLTFSYSHALTALSTMQLWHAGHTGR